MKTKDEKSKVELCRICDEDWRTCHCDHYGFRSEMMRGEHDDRDEEDE